MQAVRLYTYCRSSAAYRVRIALNLKGLDYHSEYIHLLKVGGEQFSAAYRALNPQMLVPSYCEGEQTLSQSLAIIEYLEERHPNPALLPKGSQARAQVRSLALSIACDIHPLNNLRVLRYLEQQLVLDKAARERWYCHWIDEGFSALETRLMAQRGVDTDTGVRANGDYCHGDQPSMADICLIPQVYNALRFNCDISVYPTIQRIYQHCMGLTDFQQAAPEQQADFTEIS